MIISSSPNWYSSSVIHRLSDSKFIFCSRSSLFCYTINDLDGIEKGISLKVFESKCTLVTVLEDNFIACASENGEVRVIKVDDDFEPILNYKEHQNGITALDGNGNIIMSGDTKSAITCFNRSTKQISKIRHNEQHSDVKVITLSKHDSNLAAIGYEKGIIYIVNVGDGSTAFRLRGHDGDIQSMLFHEKYFITSSKDKTIRIWESEGTNFSTLKVLKLPKASGYKSKRNGEDSSRSWISLCDLAAPFGKYDFISSGNGGDVILWSMSVNEEENLETKYEIFCDSQTDLTHQRVVFGLARCGNWLISTSMDREIKIWDLTSRKPKFSLMTNGGFVYSAAQCPTEPSLIAFGVGDGMFRTWNLDLLPINIQTVWQGVKEKVTALAWHESKLLLGFGTELGKVGVWSATSNKVKTSSNYHKKTVYSVAYVNDELLSCGGDSIILKHSEDLTKAEKNTKGKYSALATWKNYICLGHESGKLEIFKDNLDNAIDSNADLHIKYITVIKFSEKFLVTCSNSGSLVVTEKQSLKLYRRLGGHSERINSIDFNPNNELEIVTGSLDGTCQIWNIETSQPIGNFDSSSPGSVYCTIWQSNDRIFSGGDDYVFYCWSLEDCSAVAPPAGSKKKKVTRKKATTTKKTSQNEVKTEVIVNNTDNKHQMKISQSHDDFTPKYKKCFGGIISEEIKDPLGDVVRLAQLTTNEDSITNVPDHVMIFSNKSNVPAITKIVNSEINNLLRNQNYQQATELSTWLNSTLTLVGQSETKLTDMTVALSASAGYSVYKEVVKEYIKQLKTELKFGKAAAYQTSLNLLSEAIQTLIEGRLFREALILFNSRPGELDNEIKNEILAKWSERSLMGGNLALTAKCHLARNDIQGAIHVLRKRNDEPHMLAILKIANLINDTAIISQTLEQILNPVINFGRWQPLIELLVNSSNAEKVKVTDSVTIQLLLYVYFHMNISKERPEPIFKVTDILPKPEIENNNLTLFIDEINLNEDDSEISQIDKLARLCVRNEFGAQKIPDDIKWNF